MKNKKVVGEPKRQREIKIMKEEKKIKEEPICVCGEQICLSGAEVEVGGICHRLDNPCYYVVSKIKHADVIKELPQIENGSIDLIIVDPPYMKGFTKYFNDFKKKLKPNGQILWFCQPTELYDLPEKPKQILIWKEPYSPKPIRKKYREFLDIIAWYAYGNYTFNPLLWNLMNSVFEDVIIRDTRLHKWEKPETLIERLILVHTNEGDTIFDPFAGSGIVERVSKKLNRKYIGYELDKIKRN